MEIETQIAEGSTLGRLSQAPVRLSQAPVAQAPVAQPPPARMIRTPAPVLALLALVLSRWHSLHEESISGSWRSW
jgi:hypothetical protein